MFLTATRHAGVGNKEKNQPNALPRSQNKRLGSQIVIRRDTRISQAYQYRGWRNERRETLAIIC
jgi:hypothetical protein